MLIYICIYIYIYPRECTGVLLNCVIVLLIVVYWTLHCDMKNVFSECDIIS